MLHALLLAAGLTGLIPVHGVVLARAPGHTLVVRTDAVPLTMASQTRRYRTQPPVAIDAGSGVDAWLDRSTTPWTLRNAVAAGPFAPGMPQPGRVIAVDVGSALPATALIDQAGRAVQLHDAFAGRTVLLSFIFTRCPDRDVCPAISGKYAYMQSRLDPAKFALVEVTLDPPYDSPAVLRQYGAQYGADPKIWTMLTGTGSTVARLLDEFGISSLRTSTADYLHNDKLFIVTPQGRVAYVVDTAGWDPEGVMAEARAVAGMASNPFERFKLSLIASVVALCGGSQFAGIVLLELALFFLILLIVTVSLWAVARVLWGRQQTQ